MSTATDEPIQGMHCTLSNGSDRYPYEVVRVVNKRTVIVAELDALRDADDSTTFTSRLRSGPELEDAIEILTHSEKLSYETTGCVCLEIFTLRRKNMWAVRGIPTRSASRFLTLDIANFHQDPSR